MLKFISLSLLTFLISSQAGAQVYYTGWDNASEISGWTQIRKGDASLYEWTFDASNPFSPDSCLAHYYPVGGSTPTDDWYVSPVFDFSLGGSIDSLYKNYSGFGTPMAGDTIELYLLAGNQDPDLATKTVLYSFTDSTYLNDSAWRKDSMIAIPATAGTSYIAFRYKTTVNWLDVKFDNLTLTALNSSEISVIEPNIGIYPNPANQLVFLNLDQNFKENLSSIQLFDQTGRLVARFEPSQSTLDISNFEPGCYYLQFNSASTQISKQVIIE